MLAVLGRVVERPQHVRLHRCGQVLRAHADVFLLCGFLRQRLFDIKEVFLHLYHVVKQPFVVLLDFAKADPLPVGLHLDRLVAPLEAVLRKSDAFIECWLFLLISSTGASLGIREQLLRLILGSLLRELLIASCLAIVISMRPVRKESCELTIGETYGMSP